MIPGALRKLAAIAGAAIALSFAVPATAQNYSDGYKLLQAVEKKDRSDFDQLVAKNHTVINSRDLTSGRTGLHIAVARRDATWVNYLAQAGANTNIADNRGVTPIMLASQLGWMEGVQALIGHGAQVDVPNSAGETPLISAVHRRDTQMMRVMLRAGADPDRTDNSGRSARDYARLDGRDSLTLAEIEKNAGESGGRSTAGDIYGPSF
ncbi:MAG TPA: ankyrin repeat domain-containing protein [Croceibacterium sp.]|nr:ankyrin repeat domain-containing protein [Croceibacterium sp.]